MSDDLFKKIAGILVILFGMKVANDLSKMIISLIWFFIMACVFLVLIFLIGKV